MVFNPPAVRETAPPSPIAPPHQNDFRELMVSPESERATWHAELGTETTPAKPDATVELNTDEWTPITIPVGNLGTDPRIFLGDDVQRRSAVVTNIGTEDLQLATDASKFAGDATAIAPTVFVLPAGAGMTITSTRAVYVRAPIGTDAGISAFVERGARTR